MSQSVTFSMQELSMDDYIKQHRREKKELQAKIQALKKNAPKSKRKETMDDVTRLENEMDARHAAELKTAATTTTNHVDNNINIDINCEDDENENTANENSSSLTPRVTKAQKRRDKKARESREREETYRAKMEESNFSDKNIEAGLFESQLKNLQLALHEVPGDGDCLYNAVRHQILQRGLGSYSVKQLRDETANYISANKEALHCYMTHPNTGELLTDNEFDQYCDAVRDTPSWGGEVELKALSTVLRVPIEVLQAKGPATIHGAEEFPGPNLLITYHRHLLSLGEHYNSTRILDENELVEDL